MVDWFSRRVLAWRVSITMEVEFCLEAVEEALAKHGRPEIFNTDQGSQLTSSEFTGVLLDNGIAISMDSKGSWRDNVFVERLWRSMLTADHRFALSMRALLSAPAKKIVLQRQFPDLRMQRLQIHRRRGLHCTKAKHAGRPLGREVMRDLPDDDPVLCTYVRMTADEDRLFGTADWSCRAAR